MNFIAQLSIVLVALFAVSIRADGQLRGQGEIDKINEQKNAAYSAGPVVGSSTCGGNCPGGCSECPCGSSSNHQDIATWCSKYSWNQANCQCIMQNESGGNANAVNQNTGGSYDVGLWQVNDFNWNSCSGGKAPCDPNANLNCGKFINISQNTRYLGNCFLF